MSTGAFAGFEHSIIQFLVELSQNNNREWFNANKRRYESAVREPAFAFIRAMAPKLEAISPHFTAEAKKVGGSLMRVYRDVRFSTDKTPYKTNVGIQFRHEAGGDVHAPGYYVHISPESVFLGVGVYHPAAPALTLIRDAIDSDPDAWSSARNDRRFAETFSLGGDSLKRPPRGYSAEHPHIEDLKRKDFIGFRDVGVDELLSDGFIELVGDGFAAATPFMRFLCYALDVAF